MKRLNWVDLFRLALLLVAIAALLRGQVITLPQADGIGSTVARVSFSKGADATTAVYVIVSKETPIANCVIDTTTNSDKRFYDSEQPSEGTSTATPVFILSGLTPGAKHNWGVCRKSDNVLLSTNFTFRTQGPRPNKLPIPPSPPSLVTVPTSFSNTFNIDAACSNIASVQASAAAIDGNNNVRVRITAGTVCTNPPAWPAKTGANPTGNGIIVVETSQRDKLTSEVGYRWDEGQGNFVVTTSMQGSTPVNPYSQFMYVFERNDNTTNVIRFSGHPTGYIFVGAYLRHQSTSLAFSFGMMDIDCDRCGLYRSFAHSWPKPAGTARLINASVANDVFIKENALWASHPTAQGVAIGGDDVHRLLVEGNAIQGVGITNFFTNDSATGRNTDITYRRNFIHANNFYWKGQTGSDGNVYTHRQPFECKRCVRVSLEGNIWENWRSHELPQSEVILLTARRPNATFGQASTGVSIGDFSVKYNWFRDVPGLIAFIGFEGDVQSAEPDPGEGFYIGHNLVSNLDGFRSVDAGVTGTDARGIFIRTCAVGYLTIEHNTILRVEGTGPRLIDMCGGQVTPFEARSNFLPARYDNALGLCRFSGQTWPDGSVPGTEANCRDRFTEWATQNTDPVFMWTNNVHEVCNNITTATLSPLMPFGNYFPGDCTNGRDNIKFFTYNSSSRRLFDYLLTKDSPYRLAAHDGEDVGADILKLMGAIGIPTRTCPPATSSLWRTRDANDKLSDIVCADSSNGVSIFLGTTTLVNPR